MDRISRRDLTELMAKLGALSDAARFSESAVARNILAHTYLSHVDDRAERLNEALRNAVFLVQAFNEALDFVVRRRLLPVQPLTGWIRSPFAGSLALRSTQVGAGLILAGYYYNPTRKSE